jgi:hypothetical protein
MQVRAGALILAASALAVALALCSPALAARMPAAARRCAKGQSRLVAADARAQVYIAQKPIYGEQHHLLERVPVYRGCVFGSTRTVELGLAEDICSPSGCAPRARRLTLAGTLVAFEYISVSAQSSFGEGGNTEWLLVARDLRSGRTLHKVPTGTATPEPGAGRFVGAGPTTGLALTPNGALAWIVNTRQAAARYQVRIAEGSGSRLLAAGSDIDPSSLVLTASRVFWVEGHTPASVPIS